MRKLSILSASFLAICFMLLSISANVQPSAAKGPAACYFPTALPGTGYAIKLTQSSQKSAFGSAVTFKAAIVGGNWGTSYGSVIFVDGLAQIGKVMTDTVGPNGVIAFTTSNLALGDHTIWAFYQNWCSGNTDTIDSSIHGAWVDHFVGIALPNVPPVVSVK